MQKKFLKINFNKILDLELKIREISQELSFVLHKLKKEAEEANLVKASYAIKGNNKTTERISDISDEKNTQAPKNSKAYVTILREVNLIIMKILYLNFRV